MQNVSTMYRYYKAEHGLQVLNDLEIRTSIPNQLNDPFELSPNIDPSHFTKRKLESFLRADHNLNMWYQREGRESGFTSKKRYKQWYLKNVPHRAAQLLPSVPQNVEAVRKGFCDTFSKHWRMICGSCIEDSILMWSHYANNHTGMVIAFDLHADPFSKVGDDCIIQVSYSQQKPDYHHFGKVEKFRKEMFSVAAMKAQLWSYEQEIRIILALSAKTLRDSRYLPIASPSIRNVYLGCRCSAEARKSVRDALKQNRLAHVGLLRAEMNPSKYALSILNDNAP